MYSGRLHAVDYFFFFFNDTATTEIYTLSLHDALPISYPRPMLKVRNISASPIPPARRSVSKTAGTGQAWPVPDRKSTRLNSSHGYISYAVFCLKKKKSRQYFDRPDIANELSQ